MLSQFSWQHFLVASAVLTLIWYLTVILLFYRKELNTFISGSPLRDKTDSPLPHRWERDVNELPPDKEAGHQLMGVSRLPEGVSVIEMEELHFSEPVSKENKLGLLPDFNEEIRRIFQILEETDGGKNDFLRLFQEAKARYPAISASPLRRGINEFIISNAPFYLSSTEAEDLW